MPVHIREPGILENRDVGRGIEIVILDSEFPHHVAVTCSGSQRHFEVRRRLLSRSRTCGYFQSYAAAGWGCCSPQRSGLSVLSSRELLSPCRTTPAPSERSSTGTPRKRHQSRI